MKKGFNWDAIGIGTSLACAIHCALLPLFLTSLPVFGIELIQNTVFEVLMVVIAFVVGSYALYHGWRKHHHSWIPILVFCAGFVFLLLKLFFVQYEHWLLVPAVAGIVSAHLINYKSCRVHNHAHADDCNH